MSQKVERLRYAPWERLGKVDDVPLQSSEMLHYLLKYETLDLPMLSLHIVTTSVVADVLMQQITVANSSKSPEDQIVIKPDTILETMAAYHAPRKLANEGTAGHANEAINIYMKDHTDIDLATLIAIQEGLPLSLITTMEKIQRARGFPEKSVGPVIATSPSDIHWDPAITQIASWSVAGTIIPIEKRFEDLINRHANNLDSPKNLPKQRWLEYRNWGIQRINDLAAHIGFPIGDFHSWLRTQIHGEDPDGVAKTQSDNLIKEVFHREPVADEFLPVSPAYTFLARRITSLLDPAPGQRHERERLEMFMRRPQRVLELCRTYGIIQGKTEHYQSVL